MADPRHKQCSISIISNSTSISSSDTRHSGSISFSSGCLWISFYVTVFTWLWTYSLNRILCGNVGWSSIKDDSCGILSEERATHVPLSSFQPKQPITTHMDTCVIMPCHVEEEPLGHILCQLTWRWRGGGISFPVVGVAAWANFHQSLRPWWFPTYFLFLCQGYAENHSSPWGWTTPVTSSLSSQPIQTSEEHHCTTGCQDNHFYEALSVEKSFRSIFSLMKVSTSVLSTFCGVSLENE